MPKQKFEVHSQIFHIIIVFKQKKTQKKNKTFQPTEQSAIQMNKYKTQQTKETRQQKQNIQNELRFNESKLHRIRCKGNLMALRTQIRQKQLIQDQLRIIGTIKDDKSLKQLWLLKTIKQAKYQIINFTTDLVMQCQEDGGIKLQKGKQKNSQKFQIQFVNKQYRNNRFSNNHNGIKIVRIKDHNNFYLTLDGLLQTNKLDDSDENQLFEITEVQSNGFIQFRQTYIISNPQTKRCLDVTKGDQAIGTPICIYQKNNRANQRWSLDPPIENQSSENVRYSIINMLTKLRLWYDRKGGLIQSNNTQKVWQIHKKHNKSGQLFETIQRKYINKVEEDRLSIQNYSNGTKWIFQQQ